MNLAPLSPPAATGPNPLAPTDRRQARAGRRRAGAGRLANRLVGVGLLVVLMALLGAGCAGGKKKRPRRPTSEEQYQNAMELMQDKKYLKARTVLGNIGVRELQESDLDPKVKIALADAYFLDGGLTNVIEAQARYEQFINFYPTNSLVAYAQFQVGMCLLLQSSSPANDQIETHRALGEFGKVAALDTTGEFTKKAAEQIARCKEKLGKHEYDVGRFYLRRKECDAAVGRFRTVLDEYPGFSMTDAATWYMAQALICLNNTEEGKIYLEKLASDFPDSPYNGKRPG